MENIHWSFASAGGGFVDGIHNPLISHFTGNFNYHLAREIIQNSLDAKDNQNQPVLVKFDIKKISKYNIPGYEEFNKILFECKKFWPIENIDTHDFLDKAIDCLNNPEISILKCSDYNTIGLEGDDEDLKGSWFNLVRSKGASSKFKGEGGSFGIGKGAPFAASELRMIFYSTKNKHAQRIFQGISELVSFKKDNDIKRGNGSYGVDGHRSIRSIENIPIDFSRKAEDSSGLDIYIMGFKKSNIWKDELVQSVLRNFWFAILKKELIVEIAEIKIDKNSLEKLLFKHFAGEKLKDDIEPIGNPISFYNAVKSGNKFTTKLKTLGFVEFYFHEIAEPMNYTSMLRKPHMSVFSKPYRFPGNYCGVFICDNDDGNKILRKMEPPTHNRWEPESYGKDGFHILNEIHDWIRSILKSQQLIKPKGELEIPDLYKYLPFDEGTEDGEGRGIKDYIDKESEIESSKEINTNEEQLKEGLVKPYKIHIINRSEPTGLNGDLRVYGKKKNQNHKANSSIGGDIGEKKILAPPAITLNSFVTKKIVDGYEYRFRIKSDKDRNCSLKILAIGDDDSRDKIDIIKAIDSGGTPIHITGNRLAKFSLSSKDESNIYIQIRSLSKIALKAEVYEL